ncbi:hypothetical protein [Thalassotalea agariperforans]|jgi:hypothetical protein
MEWLSKILDPMMLTIISVGIPTIIIVAIFAYAAHKAHLKHIERINKIKQGYFLSEEE